MFGILLHAIVKMENIQQVLRMIQRLYVMKLQNHKTKTQKLRRTTKEKLFSQILMKRKQPAIRKISIFYLHFLLPTAATLPTSTTPLATNTSYNASPSPIHTHPHPFPQQNPNPHPLTYNLSICHSPSTSLQVTPTMSQNLNQLCISSSPAPTFNTTQSHPSSKSQKNTYPNKITTQKAKKAKTTTKSP